MARRMWLVLSLRPSPPPSRAQASLALVPGLSVFSEWPLRHPGSQLGPDFLGHMECSCPAQPAVPTQRLAASTRRPNALHHTAVRKTTALVRMASSGRRPLHVQRGSHSC